jgi:polar amino acid transport system permease protein
METCFILEPLFKTVGGTVFMTAILSLCGGFLENLQLFFITLLLAIPLGLVIAFGSMSKFKPLKWLTKTFVWVIRGTPLMLQLFVVLYAPGLLLGIRLSSRMQAAILAFVINYAAYLSEIYRGGIESISKGQYEAGQVLGMTKTQIFFRVILLQVVKRITPPLSNEVITLVKDTSLARVIGIAEVIMCAERFTKQGLIWPLFSTGLYFLIFNGILTILFSVLERKMDYFRA